MGDPCILLTTSATTLQLCCQGKKRSNRVFFWVLCTDAEGSNQSDLEKGESGLNREINNRHCLVRSRYQTSPQPSAILPNHQVKGFIWHWEGEMGPENLTAFGNHTPRPWSQLLLASGVQVGYQASLLGLWVSTEASQSTPCHCVPSAWTHYHMMH